MGLNLAKRLDMLQEATDSNRLGRRRLFKTCVLSILSFWIISYALSSFFPSAKPALPKNITEDSEEDAEVVWERNINFQYKQFSEWLHYSPFAIFPGGSEFFDSYANAVVGKIGNKPAKKESIVANTDIDEMIDLAGMWNGIKQRFSQAALRIGFLFFAVIPWWILGGLIGYFALRSSFIGKRTDDILGICTRGLGPFYSGIYGPLRPNNTISGTDYSAPSLACPAMATTQQAQTHKLGLLLKQYQAYNQTNIDLIRIILAYADYPALVGSEQSWEEDINDGEPIDHLEPLSASATGFITNVQGKVVDSALTGLEALLQAHDMLSRYIELLKSNNVTLNSLNANYGSYIENLNRYAETLSPLAKSLAFSLTPTRAWALGQVPRLLVVSAYLATEAGKSLVYKRHGNGYTRISLFPHLQARAVIQSLPIYHKEYNGDQRMVIRQAIIGARRHGDFGTAFLPHRMPIESRALRDWLEILYADPETREGIGQLVELDAQIEEISLNWRAGFGRSVKQSSEFALDPRNEVSQGQRYSRGISHKSVILTPLADVVEIALRGIDNHRLARIQQLISLTLKHQTSLSISARLPGFKRQAVEAQRGAAEGLILTGEESYNRDLLDRWTIVRRMLTKYNWLSTRVGDDAVPGEGFVQAIIYEKIGERSTIEPYPIDALVPLRQRRFDEIFGRQWEPLYYQDSPRQDAVEVYVNRTSFREALIDAKKHPGSNVTPITAASAKVSTG